MMKKFLAVLSVVAMVVLLVCAASVQAQEMPDVRMKFVKPPPQGLLELAVGESRPFEIQITSSEPFLWAMAMTDSYYPGRGIFSPGGDRAGAGTEATLFITLTGKDSTADLPAVCDWPELGDCWPEGVAPVSITTGVRFPGGLAVGEGLTFGVVVP
jgi:hypothetical protein